MDLSTPARRDRTDAAKNVDYFSADLKKRGIGESTSAPPLWRLIWTLGIELPPPHFMGYGSLALVASLPFGLLWALALWFLFWRQRGVWISASAGAAAGIIFGLMMAGYFLYSARKLKLPSRDRYPRS
jgi:hypothetical protein